MNLLVFNYIMSTGVNCIGVATSNKRADNVFLFSLACLQHRRYYFYVKYNIFVCLITQLAGIAVVLIWSFEMIETWPKPMLFIGEVEPVLGH